MESATAPMMAETRNAVYPIDSLVLIAHPRNGRATLIVLVGLEHVRGSQQIDRSQRGRDEAPVAEPDSVTGQKMAQNDERRIPAEQEQQVNDVRQWVVIDRKAQCVEGEDQAYPDSRREEEESPKAFPDVEPSFGGVKRGDQQLKSLGGIGHAGDERQGPDSPSRRMIGVEGRRPAILAVRKLKLSQVAIRRTTGALGFGQPRTPAPTRSARRRLDAATCSGSISKPI